MWAVTWRESPSLQTKLIRCTVSYADSGHKSRCERATSQGTMFNATLQLWVIMRVFVYWMWVHSSSDVVSRRMLSVTSIQRWSSCSKIQNLFLSVTNRTSSSWNTHTNNVYRFIKRQEQKISEEILVEEWLLPLTRHIPNCLQLYNGDCIAVECQRLMSPGCTAAEGLLYEPRPFVVPTSTARCLHQRP